MLLDDCRGGSEILNYLPDRGQFSWVPFTGNLMCLTKKSTLCQADNTRSEPLLMNEWIHSGFLNFASIAIRGKLSKCPASTSWIQFNQKAPSARRSSKHFGKIVELWMIHSFIQKMVIRLFVRSFIHSLTHSFVRIHSHCRIRLISKVPLWVMLCLPWTPFCPLHNHVSPKTSYSN